MTSEEMAKGTREERLAAGQAVGLLWGRWGLHRMIRNGLPADDHEMVDALFKGAFEKGVEEAEIPEGMRMLVHSKRATGLYYSRVLWVLTLFCGELVTVMGDRGVDFAGLSRIVGAAYMLLMTSPELFPFPKEKQGAGAGT